MSKVIFATFGALVVAGAVAAGFFYLYWQDFREVGPAVLPPPGDIGEVIEQTPAAEQRNIADFPLTLPEGFSISVFARDLGPARVMAWDPAGNLLVSITREGKVLALQDENGDGRADRAATVREDLHRPHGLLFYEGKLFIAESDQVAVYEYNAQTMRASHKEKIIDLPAGGGHFTRTIMRSPDNRLLVSVGSTCNVCAESDWRRAAILSAARDGSDLKLFASGLRNAVFMTTHPQTGDVWVTEMGRDYLGDDLPPDEINIVREGKDYGWPYCYGKNVPDPFGADIPASLCIGKEPSHIDLQAHSAPLGLAFVPKNNGWPEEYGHNLFVAYHGSWNRSEPTGYKIVRFVLDERGNYMDEEDFISGWLRDDGVLGRPVDILLQPGGVMYISDDHAGVIYRVVYRGDVKLP